MKTFSFKSLLIMPILGISSLLYAQSLSSSTFTKPEQAIEYRKSVFTVQARAFSQIRAMIKGDQPLNIADIKANANIIQTLSTLPWAAFVTGTDSIKTKPTIWSDSKGFKVAAEKYMLATVALNSAAKKEDINSIKTAIGTLAAACKQCHDAYKQ